MVVLIRVGQGYAPRRGALHFRLRLAKIDHLWEGSICQLGGTPLQQEGNQTAIPTPLPHFLAEYAKTRLPNPTAPRPGLGHVIIRKRPGSPKFHRKAPDGNSRGSTRGSGTLCYYKQVSHTSRGGMIPHLLASFQKTAHFTWLLVVSNKLEDPWQEWRSYP